MKKILLIFLLISVILWPLVRYSYKYDESVIRLGMSIPLSGDASEMGQNFYKGANAYFQDLNAKGGVNGRTIELLVKDDKFEPNLAVENVKELIEKEKVFALFGVVGSASSKVVLPLSLESGTPFLAALAGAKFLRQPRNSMILNVRKGYHSEIEVLLKHLVDKMKHKKIGVFFQNDSFGHSGIRSLKVLLEKRNLKLEGEGGYKRNTLTVGHALYELENANPDAIIVLGVQKPTVEFIKRLRKSDVLKDKILGIVSSSNANAVVNDLDKRAKNLLFSQVVPLPCGDDPDVKVYQRQMKEYYPDTPFGFISLEGYFAAKMVTSVFKKVGKNFSKHSYIDALHDIPKEIFKDRSIVIKDNSCGCLDKIYLTRFTKDKFEYIGNSYE